MQVPAQVSRCLTEYKHDAQASGCLTEYKHDAQASGCQYSTCLRCVLVLIYVVLVAVGIIPAATSLPFDHPPLEPADYEQYRPNYPAASVTTTPLNAGVLLAGSTSRLTSVLASG